MGGRVHDGQKRKKEEWNVGRKETEHGEGENIEKRGGKKGTRVGSVGRDDQKRDRAPRLEGIGEKKICHYLMKCDEYKNSRLTKQMQHHVCHY